MTPEDEDLLKTSIQNLLTTVTKQNDSIERLTRLLGIFELRLKKLEMGENKPRIIRANG